ncbi:unnamed protein product, partial [Amoebophrya sp. A120]|eukprot:GSA120T00007040001.1
MTENQNINHQGSCHEDEDREEFEKRRMGQAALQNRALARLAVALTAFEEEDDSTIIGGVEETTEISGGAAAAAASKQKRIS